MAQKVIGDLSGILENTVIVELERVGIALRLISDDAVDTSGEEMAVLQVLPIASTQSALTNLGHGFHYTR
jgi:hypothetical protein